MLDVPKTPNMLAKPGNGLMRVYSLNEFVNPRTYHLLNAKLVLLEEAQDLNMLSPDVKTKDLAKPVEELVGSLFPRAGYMYLLKEKDNYNIVSSANLDFNPKSLDINSPESLVRYACDSDRLFRRTIFLMNTENPYVFLGSKMNRIVNNEYSPGNHQLEEGPIDQCGFKIDNKKLAKIGIRSIAVAPVMWLDWKDEPLGALILACRKGILDPFMDLLVLRELADYLAETIYKSMHK